MLLSTGGKVIRTRAGEVRVCGRRTQGVMLFRVAEETLVSVDRIERTGAEDESELQHLEIEDAGEPEEAAGEDETDEAPEADDAEPDEGGEAEPAAKDAPKGDRS